MKLQSYQQFNESTELINIKELNLWNEYETMYQKLIDNNVFIHSDIPVIDISTNNLKTKRAVTEFTNNMVGSKYVSSEVHCIKFSTYLPWTYQQFLNTLAHEIIHVYMLYNKIYEREGHGPLFIKYMDKINLSNLGVIVSLNTKIDSIVLDENDKLKKSVIVIELTNKSSTNLSVCNSNIFKSDIIHYTIAELNKNIRMWEDMRYTVRVYTSKDIKFKTHKISPKLNYNFYVKQPNISYLIMDTLYQTNEVNKLNATDILKLNI